MLKFEPNARVLISGGTGSFGSTMAKHLLRTNLSSLRIFSRDESKQDQLRHELNDRRVEFFIGDVRDDKAVGNAMRGVNYVFHAAALKQVPSAEFFPLEAVQTNVLGSSNILRAAVSENVKNVVCLSTDKAVYPINAMGQSKALMEKTAVSIARHNSSSNTKIAVTRYGNVMASRGSVLPLFISQIKLGKPITITEPTMTRFLMSLEESVELVLHAFSEGQTGDTLVKKAPAATIRDLVEAVKILMDVPNHPVEIIGIRHGEKLFESLLSAEEMASALDEGSFFRVPMDSRSLNYEIYAEQGRSIQLSDSYTSHNTTRLSVDEIVRLVRDLPELKSEFK